MFSASWLVCVSVCKFFTLPEAETTQTFADCKVAPDGTRASRRFYLFTLLELVGRTKSTRSADATC